MNKIKIICPICGQEMDESYLSFQMCWKCQQQLNNVDQTED